MKIGVISDIHGNYDGLLRALDLLRGKGVEQIVCAGDLVERGLAGDAVVSKIREEAIPCVQGNHDRDAVFNQFWLLNNADLQNLEVMSRLLNRETLEFLKQLPPVMTFEWERRKVMLAHGTPWSKDTYLFVNNSTHVYERVFSVSKADIVLLGHTHMPMAVQMTYRWVFNPGSLWNNHETHTKTCAMLTLPECQFEVFDVENGQPVEVERAEIKP
jgi:putative phosphoesterase